MSNTKMQRIHRVCADAIFDIKTKTKDRIGKDITEVDASFLLGKKYWRKNFGKISDSELKKIFKLKYGLR